MRALPVRLPTRPSMLLAALLAALTLLALSACGGARGSYNPFAGPDHAANSGHVDTRPMNGR